MTTSPRVYAMSLCIAILFGLTACTDDVATPTPSEGALTYRFPSWSADNVIAYADLGGRIINSHGTTRYELAGVWTFDLRDGSSQQVTNVRARSVSWAPDAAHLVICTDRSLWMLTLESGQVDSLVDDGAWNNPGDWSPCDSSIVFCSDRDANVGWTLWQVDPRSRQTECLLNGEGGVEYPHFVAGCDTVLYGLVNDDFSIDIMWIDIESRTRGLVLNTSVNVEDIDISPNGRYISYTEPSSNGGVIRIYDRNRRIYVAGPRGHGQYASWSPDSQRIVFVERASTTENGVNCHLVTYTLDSREMRVVF